MLGLALKPSDKFCFFSSGLYKQSIKPFKMNWILLIIAGLFEVAFATCLGKVKETTGTEATFWFIGFLVSVRHSN